MTGYAARRAWIFFLVFACAHAWAEPPHAGTGTAAARHGAAPGDGGVTVRDRNGFSPAAFRETLAGADEVWRRNREDLYRFRVTVRSLDGGTVLLLLFSTAGWAVLLVTGYRRISARLPREDGAP